LLAWLLCLVCLLPGCQHKQPAAQPASSPSVTVAHPVEHEVVEWDTYSGYLEAPESVNVAARVAGMVVAAPYEEGSLVKKGQLLFEIDERPFQAQLDARLADEQKARAQVEIARRNLRRLDEALQSNAVSQQEYDIAKSTGDQAEATLAAATAAVETARLDVEWCKVTSPIDGRAGRKLVTVGNLVNMGAAVATPLTTVESVDPIYCSVDIDERSVLKYQRLAAEHKLPSIRAGKLPCCVRLADERSYLHEGVVDFLDNHLDQATGTMRARGVVPNPSGLLTPGFFASMRLPGSGPYHTLLVPDIAIGNDQDTHTVLVVDAKDEVESRRVEIGALFGSMRSITSGLVRDDRVIINGQMRAHPGAKVKATEATIKYDPAILDGPGSASEPGPSEPPAGAGRAAPPPADHPAGGKTP
jgi:RND family efflux transporter MFP subunit